MKASSMTIGGLSSTRKTTKNGLDERVRNIVFGTVYGLGYNDRGVRVDAGSALHGGKLLLLVRTLQLLAFPLSTTFDFAWNDTWTSWFRELCAVARLDPFIVGDSVEDMVPYASLVPVVVVVVLWLTLLVATRVFLFDEEKGHYKPSMWVSASRVSSAVMSKWLFIPILSLLLRTNRCNTNGSMACWGSDHAAHAALADITALLFVIPCAAFWALSPSRMPPRLNKDTHQFEVAPDAVVHTRMQQIEFCSIVVLVLAFSSASTNSESTLWALAACTALVSGVLAFAPYYFLPFYDFGTNVSHGCANWIVAWASLCLLMVQITDDKAQIMGSMMLFGTAPMVVIACFFFMNQRRQDILLLRPSELSSAEEVELWTRFSLQQRISDWNAKATQEAEATRDTSKKSNLSGADKDAFAEIGDMLRVAARPFSTSPLLQVLKCEFVLNVLGDRNKAAYMLARVRSRQFPADWAYAVFVLRRQDQDNLRNLKDGELVHSYIRFVEFYENALDSSKSAYRAVYELWAEMQQTDVDLQHVDQLGEDFNKSVSTAHHAFQEVLSLNRNSGKVMTTYAQFVKQLLNDDEQGSNLEQRALELTRKTHDRHGLDNDQSVNPVERIFDDSTGVITISAEVDDLGEILAANDAVCDLVGRTRAQLVGNHVSSLMPQPFSNVHGSLMTQLLAPSDGKSLLDRTIPVYMLHLNGYLVSTNLTVKRVSGGLTKSAFMGILTAASSNANHHVCLVDVKTRKVLRASSGCAQMFNINVSDIADGYNTQITRFIPDLDVSSSSFGSGGRSAPEDSDTSDDESDVDSDASDSDAPRKRYRQHHKNEYRSADGKEFVLKDGASEYVLQVRVQRVEYDGTAVDVVRMVEKAHRIDDGHGGKLSMDEHDAFPDMTPLGLEYGADNEDTPCTADSDDGDTDSMSLPLGFKPSSEQVRQPSSRSPAGRRKPTALRTKKRTPIHLGIGLAAHSREIESPRMSGDETDGRAEEELLPADEATASARSVSSKHQVRIKINNDAEVQSHYSGRMSATSGRSGMSAVAFRNSLSHIRNLFLNRSDSMDRSILMFRGAFLLTVLILIALAVVGTTVSTSSFDSFKTQIQEIQAAGWRRTYALIMEYEADTMNLMKYGYVTPFRVPVSQGVLLGYVDNLQTQITNLYLNNDELTDEHLRLYNHPSIVLESIEGRGIVEQKFGLAQALTLLASHAKFLAELTDPLDYVDLDHPDVFFLHNNPFDRIVPAINTSTLLYEEASLDSAQDVEDLQQMLLAVSLVVVVVMMVAVFAPTITRVERTRREIFDMFLHVKIAHAEQLQREAREALETMTGHEQSDWNDVDDEEEEAGDVAKHLRKRHMKRSLVNEGHRKQLLLSKVAVLIVGSALFFIIVYVIETEALHTSTRRLPELNWSNERALNLVRAVSDTRNLISFPQTSTDPHNPRPKTFDNLLARAKEAVINVRVINQALLFGNDALRLREASLKRYPVRDEITYGDACRVLERQEGRDYDECAAFDDGVATLGLDNLIENYLRMASTLISECEARHTAGEFNTTDIAELLGTKEFQLLEGYFGTWMRYAVLRAETQYEEEQFEDIEDFVRKRNLALYVFLAACVAMYIVIYDPMIRRLDRDLKRTRGSLLMIPVHVMNKTPALRKGLASAKWL